MSSSNSGDSYLKLIITGAVAAILGGIVLYHMGYGDKERKPDGSARAAVVNTSPPSVEYSGSVNPKPTLAPTPVPQPVPNPKQLILGKWGDERWVGNDLATAEFKADGSFVAGFPNIRQGTVRGTYSFLDHATIEFIADSVHKQPHPWRRTISITNTEIRFSRSRDTIDDNVYFSTGFLGTLQRAP